ncbi:hypothetical protein JXR93_09345 [bacterium]|nr:hypothetical protein [bacterium]
MKILITIVISLFLLSCGEEIDNPYYKIENISIKINYISASNSEIPISEPIVITFNQRVYSSSIYQNIDCYSGSESVDFSYRLNRKSNGEDELTLFPYYPYIPFVRYRCFIKKEIKNIYGSSMEQDVMFDFKTNRLLYPNQEFLEVKYKDIYPYLKSKCSICHNKQSNNKNYIKNNRLSFDKSSSHFIVTNDSFETYESMKEYIVSGDHQESLLIKKLIGIGIQGDKMPPNEQIPLYEIERISSWIYFGGNFE